MSRDPVIDKAIVLRDRLLDVAKEHDIIADRTAHHATKELAKIDAKTCRDAAAMLQKLGTEVTRLRLGIGHLEYGQIDRITLCSMARNWNGDRPASDEAAG